MLQLQCRACLSTEQRLVPFNNTNRESYNLFTSLNVKESDGLPQTLCELCFNKIEVFVTFRLNCINSEEILRTEYESSGGNKGDQGPKNSESDTKIKIEASSFIDGDDDDMEADSFLEEVGEDALQIKEEDMVMNKVEVTIKPEINTDCDLGDPQTFFESTNLFNKEIKGNVFKKRRGRPRKTEEVKPKNVATVTKKTKVLKKTPVKQEKTTVEKKPRVKRERKCISQVKKETEHTDKVQNLQYCGLCPLQFQSKDKLGSHVESHKDLASCQICGESLPIWQKALCHRYSHMPLKTGLLECHLCGYRYGSNLAFESHYVVDHIQKGTKDFTCIHCFRQCPTRRALQKHLILHSDKQFFCDYCMKCYNQKTKLRLHITRLHSDLKPYQCDQCPKAFGNPQRLITHRSVAHMPQRIYCKQCRRHFPDDRRLRNHKCHSPRQCNICGKIMHKSGQLRIHLRVHSDEHTFLCTRCPSKFKSQTALKAHNNRHDNIRPYECPYCPDKFFTGDVMKKHIAWKHTGERNHVCKICSKGFAAVHNLRVHMRVHGEYLIQSKKEQLANADATDFTL